jgi:hypothetical protein
MALLEGQQEVADGILLHADGRRLLLPRGVAAGVVEEEGATADPAVRLEPGVFVRYRGHWGDGGVVVIEELTTQANRLEEKEKEIHQKYQPHLLLPAQDGSGPGVLKIDKNRYPLVDNPELQLYANQVGTRLLPKLWQRQDSGERLGPNFWFLVAVHERPQASAFPSGVVVIHSGLFTLAENEAQLAFAIAHEIAHVTQEHAWREYQYHRGKLQALRWSTAGLGYLVESAIRRGYQRNLEGQADRLALWYLAQAGYDPREGLRFLRRLEERQEGLSALLWDTHRSYASRRRAVLEGLLRFSQAGLPYRTLTTETGEFVSFRDRVPRAKIDTAEELH